VNSNASVQGPEGLQAACPTAACDPASWVDAHGDFLFRFALLRVRDPVQAEDLLQETFLAALQGRGSFRGGAEVRTWLAGILKNKIFDYFRKRARETCFTDMEFYSAEENEQFRSTGLKRGEWTEEAAPADWLHSPGASFDQEAFWSAFHSCSAKLPQPVAIAFTLREVEELESKEICALLNVSENNLWVMLHRARLALRRCLQKNWIKQ
jgi:RNA polymerase sigma-70 factor, ECF subfamily